MSESWLLRVYEDGALAMFKEVVGPVELGRQDDRAYEQLYQVTPLAEKGCRVAIAPSDEVSISRRLAWVEDRPAGRLLVRNLSAHVSFGVEGAARLRPGQECEAVLPLVLIFGGQVVRIQAVDLGDSMSAIQSLENPTDLPFIEKDEVTPIAPLNLQATTAPDLTGVIGWLRAVIRVLQSAAGDSDFFQKAAQAMVEVVHLDLGRVLTREGDRWKLEALFPDSSTAREEINLPSRLVLNRICAEKRATWFDPLAVSEDCGSLAGVSSVVAAPVLSRRGEVIAVLYGERHLRSLLAPQRSVSRIDAMLTEVLAVGVSTGLARMEQERAALALQAQFEQFFTPELARQLANRPELLTGQDQEITALFCDIRGFSRITRNHGTDFTLDWINDVLSTLSDCVLQHSGVLVDYIGDELMAMWGAPEVQPDHAERACRAAIDMIGSLTALNERWQERLGEPLAVGIGINTGMARVGNTGSRRKFKYGPLGNTVNVASRVQGAAKYFKSSLLVTRETRERLGPEFSLRRLGFARVVNIGDPIELFELFPHTQAGASELCSAYEEALAAFERGAFRLAVRVLARLVNAHPDDGPAFALLARAMSNVVDEPENFDPAFRLKEK
jgi:adenylate cyclase